MPQRWNRPFSSVPRLGLRERDAWPEPPRELKEPEEFFSYVDMTAEQRLAEIRRSRSGMLKAERKAHARVKHLIETYWGRALDLADAFISGCVLVAENFIVLHLVEREPPDDFRLIDLVTKLHARGCLVGSEMAALLRSGFPDGALGRWRSLHELTITAQFLVKHGLAAADSFLDHEVVAAFRGGRLFRRYEDRLGFNGPELDVLERLKEKHDEVLMKHGQDFAKPYGWAKPFLGKLPDNFASLEESVHFDHFRPLYHYASTAVHAQPKSVRHHLGLSGISAPVLLSGPSALGLRFPFEGIARSLSLLTETLLSLRSDGSTMADRKVVTELRCELMWAAVDAGLAEHDRAASRRGSLEAESPDTPRVRKRKKERSR